MMRKHLGATSALWIPLVLLVAVGAGAADKPGTPLVDPTYAALRAARPDGRVATVHGLAFDRDAFHFELDGTVHYLAPVAGRTVGAVFLGHGTVRLKPATATERNHLALCLGAGKDFEVLSDTFDEMVLLFADDTAAEIGLTAPAETRAAPDPQALRVFDRWRDRQIHDFHLNLQLRLLRDLLNEPALTSGVFMALLEGHQLPPSLLAVDPRGAEALLRGAERFGGEHTLLYAEDAKNPARGGMWYLSDSRAEIDTGHRAPRRPLASAAHYWVDTNVTHGTDLGGVTTIEIHTAAAGLRVLPLNLLPRLRIASAEFGLLPAAAASGASSRADGGEDDAGEPESRQAMAVVQEDAKADGGDAAVIFPQPLPAGSRLLLRIAYQGDAVLIDGGDKNFVVRARTSWYPNLGVFAAPARFDLVYRVPTGNQVVSVGRLISTHEQGGQNVSTWKTDKGVRVAGFNYGQFKELKSHEESGGVEVAVFTNPGTPDIVRTINAVLEASGNRDLQEAGVAPGEIVNTAPQATLGHVNTSRLAAAAMADGVNAARVYTTYFGPLAENHVAITQQSQFTYGQSWPSLIFMPYIAFLDSTQRQRIGMNGAKDFVDRVGFHEFAHQWWGHLVAADSYRDQWMEEGFAEFSAALTVQHTEGWKAYDHIWREARRAIFLTPPHSAVANIDAGPISEGLRLSTERSPFAYQALVYSKGAYVLHMLRMLMWDNAAAAPDHRFIEMMRDYTDTYAGKQATTADFQKVVERHMVPALNATGDNKMDWFFRQWVYGTEAPRYTSALHLEPAGDQVRIRGQVTQDGVSADFRTLVPIYLDLDRGQVVRVGLLPMVGRTTVPVDVLVKPPKKPRGALINAHGEVLARD